MLVSHYCITATSIPSTVLSSNRTDGQFCLLSELMLKAVRLLPCSKLSNLHNCSSHVEDIPILAERVYKYWSYSPKRFKKVLDTWAGRMAQWVKNLSVVRTWVPIPRTHGKKNPHQLAGPFSWHTQWQTAHGLEGEANAYTCPPTSTCVSPRVHRHSYTQREERETEREAKKLSEPRGA